MTQTFAIFLDAYRELNAKKLFWITLIISALIIAVFGLFGVTSDAVTILGIRIPSALPAYFYKEIFDWVVVWFWLSIAATALALVSTGGLFPDFISGGSVDLYLSKPIGRLRLFFTKYLTGLLFVFLQVAVFAVGTFIVLGTRLGEWKPSLFMAVPLVVCFFSYLFSLCVLLGVLTRSTIAALLVTILFWGMLFGFHQAESFTLFLQTVFDVQIKHYEKQEQDAQTELGGLNDHPPDSALLAESRRSFQQKRLDKAREVLAQSEPTARRMHITHSILYGLMTVLPKTSETTDMLDRWLYSDKELEEKHAQDDAEVQNAFGGSEQMTDFQQVQNAKRDHARMLRTRSPVWIIGTSLAFEAVMVALAAWIFCRRDY